MRDYETEDRINEALRAKRRAERRKKRLRRAKIKRVLVLAALLIVLIAIIAGAALVVRTVTKKSDLSDEEAAVTEELDDDSVETDDSAAEDADGAYLDSGAAYSAALDTLDENGYFEDEDDEDDVDGAGNAASTSSVYVVDGRDEAEYLGSDEVVSTNALVVDVDTMTAVAQKGASDIIYPASMTKVLTLLVAVENITDLDDTFEITVEITDYSYSNDCSAVGFSVGEVVTVEDLLYGTILPSGADAAAGLAYYVSGSLEGFVELMNEKLEELGISDTAHFTNCVGLYDDDHYCTLYDLAVIMEAAIDNEICREVLSAHTYTTSATTEHPDGITISNWFLRRIEDKETGGEVVCGKTGYVLQSGNCAVSYSVTDSGKQYIVVTANSTSSWRCIYDHVAIYNAYTE